MATTSLTNHVDQLGALPKMEIVNWGKYIALRFKVGDHETTSFIHPAADESTGDFIARIRAEFVNLDVKVKDPNQYV